MNDIQANQPDTDEYEPTDLYEVTVENDNHRTMVLTVEADSIEDAEWKVGRRDDVTQIHDGCTVNFSLDDDGRRVY